MPNSDAAATGNSKFADDSAESKNERSTIVFPYGDLDGAVQVAKGVHAVGGTQCTMDQLAANLDMVVAGGSFRVKTISAKIFQLTDYSRGTIYLTQLGQHVCDPNQEKKARAEAFLRVPLYKAIYEKYRGATLPPSTALESEMVNLGVAKKQADKARQAFYRSAGQASFFPNGSMDRLVVPATGPGTLAAPEHQSEKPAPPEKEHGGNGGGGHHQLIAGLIKTLPPEGSPWQLDDRRKWLQAAAMIFNLIYTDTAANGGSINVAVQGEKA